MAIYGASLHSTMSLEIFFGPPTPLGMGGAIAALYGGLVYLTPLLGGFVADRFIGRTLAVIFGAVTMAVGHFCMAFDQTYLVALACILIGSGFFKGNLAAQVGDLYAPGDLRRADAFQIYVLAIQIAVIVSPIVCGFLGQKVAWHFGFGAAGCRHVDRARHLYFGRPLAACRTPAQARPHHRIPPQDSSPARASASRYWWC